MIGLLWLAATATDTVLGVSTDTWKGLLMGAGGLGSVFAGGIVWWRKNRVEGAKADLDVDAMAAGQATIKMLQDDLTRLRQTMVDADTKWRADMDKLEARLAQMSDQVDAAIAARRVAEENAARLRFQLQQLGQTPAA